MYRLLERLDDVVDHLVDAFVGVGFEALARLAPFLEDLFAIGIDLLAGFFETLFGRLRGRRLGVGADLFGLLAGLFETPIVFCLGVGDDLRCLALGLLDTVENLGPGHLSVVVCQSAYMGVAKYLSRSLVIPGKGCFVRSGELTRCGPNYALMGLLEDKDRARLFYKYLSTVYDRINPFIWNEEMRTDALDLLDIEADDRVLDVGCGTGFATEGLLEHTENVYGLDQSPHQLDEAFEKFGTRGPVQFCLGDAERLPFAEATFDLVWSSGSIEYWPNPVDALKECRRVARPGGQVLIVGPNYPGSTIFQKLADAIMLFYDAEEADRMFKAAGFQSVEHVTMGPSYNPEIAITTVARVPE